MVKTDVTSESLIRALYPELREMAARLLRRERDGHTLQRTALVHETFLRLFRNTPPPAMSRPEFLALAAHQMRNILIDYGRKHSAQCRGGGVTRVPLFESACGVERDEDGLLALNEALNRLANLDPRLLSVVELKFFAGFTTDETAGILGVSTATVEQDWKFSKSWLFRELTKRPACHA